MQEFWDARADENAMFFVDNRLDYSRTDAEEFWRRGEEDLDAILTDLGVTVGAGETVIDLGCGIGRMTRPLAARARHVLALDISERMLSHAREANPQLANVTWLHGDGTALTDVDDVSVDGVFSFVVLQHVPDPAIVLGYIREMGRVLRPGGWAAFQVSTDPSVHRAPAPAKGLGAVLARRGPKGQDDPAWVGTAIDPADLQATLASVGLRVRTLLNEGTQFCLCHAVK